MLVPARIGEALVDGEAHRHQHPPGIGRLAGAQEPPRPPLDLVMRIMRADGTGEIGRLLRIIGKG